MIYEYVGIGFFIPIPVHTEENISSHTSVHLQASQLTLPFAPRRESNSHAFSSYRLDDCVGDFEDEACPVLDGPPILVCALVCDVLQELIGQASTVVDSY